MEEDKSPIKEFLNPFGTRSPSPESLMDLLGPPEESSQEGFEPPSSPEVIATMDLSVLIDKEELQVQSLHPPGSI